jgi:hypothetical protein
VITSTVLTLLVIPTFYDIITRWRDALGRKFRKHPKHPLPAHAPAKPASEPPPAD